MLCVVVCERMRESEALPSPGTVPKLKLAGASHSLVMSRHRWWVSVVLKMGTGTLPKASNPDVRGGGPRASPHFQPAATHAPPPFAQCRLVPFSPGPTTGRPWGLTRYFSPEQKNAIPRAKLPGGGEVESSLSSCSASTYAWRSGSPAVELCQQNSPPPSKKTAASPVVASCPVPRVVRGGPPFWFYLKWWPIFHQNPAGQTGVVAREFSCPDAKTQRDDGRSARHRRLARQSVSEAGLP